MTTETFRAFRVEQTPDGYAGHVQRLAEDALPGGDLTVGVAYSSLNYKDALSATGNRGVTKSYPHTPGIDAAGTVLASSDGRFNVGDEVTASWRTDGASLVR